MLKSNVFNYEPIKKAHFLVLIQRLDLLDKFLISQKDCYLIEKFIDKFTD